MNKFKKWAIDNRYSVILLAKTIGVSQSTMSRILNGKTEAKLKVAIAIEKFTNGEITIKDLIKEDKDV